MPHKYLLKINISIKSKLLFITEKTPLPEDVLWHGNLPPCILNLSTLATLLLGKELLIPIGYYIEWIPDLRGISAAAESDPLSPVLWSRA
jgi:hypothetical protein